MYIIIITINMYFIYVVFQNFTQYIPLSIYDLHLWMASPSIYVFDCSSAGSIVGYVKKNLLSSSARDNVEFQVIILSFTNVG